MTEDLHTSVDEHEPDYRFTLANERTYLAWVRTALALVAGAVALDQFLLDAREESIRLVLAGCCIVFAAMIAVSALYRWRAVQSAMRRGRALPSTRLTDFTLIGVLVVAAVSLVLVFA